MNNAITEVSTSLINTDGRFRRDFGDIDSLAASIDEIGLLQPIGVDANYRLVFGHRRLLAFQKLGREKIPARFINIDSILKGEYAENEFRKDWTPSERVAIGLALEAELGERRGRPEEKGENFPTFITGRNRDIAAAAAGFGNGKTYEQAKNVVETGVTELVDAVDSGRASVSAAAAIADAPAGVQREIVARVDAGETTFAKAAQEVHNHRAQGTGENEWYTPDEHLEAAREVLGAFDLDPASSEQAQRKVGAGKFYSITDDGLKQPWAGRVFMNPPYAQPAISHFIEKLASSVEAGEVTEAIALTHNYTDTQWFHRAAGACDAICFTRGRIGFLSPEGKRAAPTQGQAFFYFGGNPEKFAEVFSRFGLVVSRMEVRK